MGKPLTLPALLVVFLLVAPHGRGPRAQVAHAI
jgi:hypothetical protein